MMLELPFEPPVQSIKLPGATDAVSLWMKREDLLDPHISGNKWRKLKYVLQDAKQKDKRHLVSFGGAYSNHLVALAEAAHRYGFESTAFVRGEAVSNHMLAFCKSRGMHLHFVSRSDYRNKAFLFQSNFGNNPSAYMIDEGGRGELAARGCEEILNNVTGFTHVVCAVGTGTTLAGIARAASRQHIIAEGICVLKGAEAMDAEVKALAGSPLHIHHGFSRRGYGKSDAALENFMQQFEQQNGFALDNIYTGKLCMAVAELIHTGYYRPPHKLLLIHTGGLFVMHS